MDRSLAHLLASWADDREMRDRRELVILVLETVRDDLSQAQRNDGERCVEPRAVQMYLTEQIAELRRLWKETREHAAD